MPFRLPPYEVHLVADSPPEASWGLILLGIPELWKQTKGEGVRVAVLDTGVDAAHPDLREAIDASRDFTGEGTADLNSHGTHTAGTIGARDGGAWVGVAPLCRLLVGKVLGADGSGSTGAITAGIRWAITQKADVISMSLGSPEPDASLEQAILAAVAAGCVVVCAAGNDGLTGAVGYPARYPSTVSVAAVNRLRQVAQFSSRGRIDVSAPGEKILSTWPGGRYAVLSGTSMATPFVAGAVALMLSRFRAAGKADLVRSPALILDLLHHACLDIDAPGVDVNSGYGLLLPEQLLSLPAEPPAPPAKPQPPEKEPDMDTAKLKETLDSILDLAAKAAKFTPSAVDDAAVAVLRHMVDDTALLEILLSRLKAQGVVG